MSLTQRLSTIIILIFTSHSLNSSWELIPIPPTNNPLERIEFVSIVFNSQILIIGGFNHKYLSDVLSSTDGLHWTTLTPSAAFGPRASHSVVEHNNKLQLTGGFTNNGKTYKWLNDVWASADGRNWELVNGNAPFSPRQRHSTTSFLGKLFLIGGNDNVNIYNDIWTSVDGGLWENISDQVEKKFQPRSCHCSFVLRDKMYVLGGYSEATFLNDIWTTKDGINWEMSMGMTNRQLLGRWKHNCIVKDDYLYMIGGESIQGRQNQLVRSSDELNFEGLKPKYSKKDFLLLQLSNFKSVILDDQLQLFGGQLNNLYNQNSWKLRIKNINDKVKKK